MLRSNISNYTNNNKMVDTAERLKLKKLLEVAGKTAILQLAANIHIVIVTLLVLLTIALIK